MENYLIDVHSHIYDEKMNLNINQIIENANKNNVKKIITVGSDLKSSMKCVKIAEAHKDIFASIGIHPSDVESICADDLMKLENLAKSEKVVAIGEIGLDYCHINGSKENQIKYFVEQIKIADKLSLPIQIHVRDAVGDLLNVLKENKEYINNGGIIHCFNGSEEVLKILNEYNLGVSVGGILTFKNAKNLPELMKSIDKNSVMLETDCPYLSPVPFRGKINQPANVLYVAQKLSELWNVSIQKVMQITSQNANSVFRLGE